MADPTPTERRLLDSIRKVKSEPESGEASRPADSPKPQRAAAVRIRSRRGVSGTGAGKTEAKPAASTVEADAYRVGRRVWPD